MFAATQHVSLLAYYDEFPLPKVPRNRGCSARLKDPGSKARSCILDRLLLYRRTLSEPWYTSTYPWHSKNSLGSEDHAALFASKMVYLTNLADLAFLYHTTKASGTLYIASKWLPQNLLDQQAGDFDEGAWVGACCVAPERSSAGASCSLN